MAIALVAHKSASGNGSSAATTAAADTSGSSLLVVAAASYSGGTTAVITDSKGNTWTNLTLKSAGVVKGRISYAENAVVGSGHTFSGQATDAYPAIAMQAYSGVATSSAFDVENGAANGTVASAQPGSITPSSDNEVLVYAMTGGNNTDTLSVNVGAFSDQQLGVPAQAFSVDFAYQIQTTATARNPTFSWSTACDATTEIASFKAAAATSAVKTINGLVYASIKTVNGLATAAVKTVNGLA